MFGTIQMNGTRRINHSGFCWSRHDGVAVASAEPYASYLHFAPEDNHSSTSSVRFLWAGCPSWHPPTVSKHWRPDSHRKKLLSSRTYWFACTDENLYDNEYFYCLKWFLITDYINEAGSAIVCPSVSSLSLKQLNVDFKFCMCIGHSSVSYTHLTLPTNREV